MRRPGQPKCWPRSPLPGNSAYLREKAAFWLGAQRGHEGLLALRQLVHSEQDNKLREKLVFDLSINSDPAAIDDLIQMAKSDADSRVRAQALFWLAQKAGKKAIGTLNASIENDPNFEVKKKAVFALSQLPREESVPATGARRRHQFQLRHSQGSNLLAGTNQRSACYRLHRAIAETLNRRKMRDMVSPIPNKT